MGDVIMNGAFSTGKALFLFVSYLCKTKKA